MAKDEKISVLLKLYESAMTQSNHEGDLIWQKFSAFIVTHGIFFALIGGIITSKTLDDPSIYIFILSLVGFLLSIFWLISTIRGFDALHYWQNTGIEIADNLYDYLRGNKHKELKNYYDRGWDFFKNDEEVKFDFGYKKPKLQLQLKRTNFTRFIYKIFNVNTEWTAYISILLILLLYVIVLIIFLRNIVSINRYHPINNLRLPQQRQFYKNYYK
jgi:hypothetical protein